MINTASTELDERTRLVERIAAGDLFRRSPRLRDFLLYAADCTLNNRLADVREQVIAERVFGRRPEFNGGQDSIVRAEARNLRKRLEAYFETEGRDEPIVIIMPKGGYALAFVSRAPATESQSAALRTDLDVVPTVTALPEIVPEPLLQRGNLQVLEQLQPSSRWRSLCILLAVIAATASGLAVYWHSANADLRNTLRIQKPDFPFSALFGDGKQAFIITSDTGMLQISNLAHRRISLDEYMARSYSGIPKTDPPDLMSNWNLYEFTDGREMAIAGLIMRSYAQYAQRIELRSGHEIQLADFKDHSAILIGSAISNPWAQVYEDKLNFATDLTPDGRIIFRNKSPRPHEPTQYPDADDIQHHRTYARLVFLPETSDAGATLLVAGTTAQSTQAAGELLLDGKRLATTLHAIGIDAAGPPHFFEILIRLNNFVGGAVLPEVVASRTRKAPD